MDLRSRLEALSRFTGKLPVFRGLPFISKGFLAENGEGTLPGLFPSLERIRPSSSRYEGSPVLLNMLPDLTR